MAEGLGCGVDTLAFCPAVPGGLALVAGVPMSGWVLAGMSPTAGAVAELGSSYGSDCEWSARASSLRE